MVNQHRVFNTNRTLIVILGVMTASIIALSIAVIVNFIQPTETLSAEEYQNLATQILNEDVNHERGQEVIDYAIKADKLLKTQDSAVFVLNLSAVYDIENVRNQYNEILRQRIIDAGFDPDMEGQG